MTLVTTLEEEDQKILRAKNGTWGANFCYFLFARAGVLLKHVCKKYFNADTRIWEIEQISPAETFIKSPPPPASSRELDGA